MMRKVFGVKNITHLLYGIIVLLPMMAVLGRVFYTVANKNANQSYSDIKQVRNVQITTEAQLQEGFTYVINDIDTTANTFIFYSPQAQQICEYFGLDNTLTYVGFNFDTASSNKFVNGYTEYNTTTRASQHHSGNINWIKNLLPISFTLTGHYGQRSLTGVTMYQQNIVYESLDNAFEYSLKTFTEDNNLGEVDMFSWFTDLFLDHSNAHNQIYIGFVNWYLNYTMLVSCGYLFFLVLIWFINFIRKILDKSMYQDYGGF